MQIFAQQFGGVVLNDDNDESRRTVEACYRTRKTLVNPIIDWTDEDVWEFIHEYNIPYCELYDKGRNRLGCIGCPMGGKNGMLRDFENYPKYKAEYLRCFDKMMQNRIDKKLNSKMGGWKSGKDIFDWWTRQSEQDAGMTLFDDE